MTFLNPLVLLGLAAAAIPILVHLFNLRRPQKVDFSSLVFVKELERRTMRRMRLRQWLLMALRVLAIACLVLAFSRPVLTGDVAGTVGAPSAASRALVVDNSLSMMLRGARGARLDQAKEQAASLLQAMTLADEMFVVPTASGDTLSDAAYPGPEAALEAIASLEVRPGATTLAAAAHRAAEKLRDAAHLTREVYLISDLQKSTLTDSLVGALPSQVRVRLLPVGTADRRSDNVAVTGVEVMSRIVDAGQPVRLKATLHNYGTQALTSYVASVYLEGARVAQTTADLASGQAATVTFTTTPQQRGWLSGRIEIEDDAFPPDNTRYFALHVPEERHLLLVRGAGQSAHYVELALSPEVTSGRLAFETKTIGEEALPGTRLGAYDAVALVGLQTLSSGERAALARYVERGGGLLFFPGADASLGDYNALLEALGGGRFEGYAGTPGDGRPVATFARIDLTHPLFEGVFDETGEEDVQPERPEVYYAATYVPRSGTGQTLIELTNRRPFLQEIRHGRGTVLLMAVAPSERWSELPTQGLFVPLIYRALYYLSAGASVQGPELLAGQPDALRLTGVPDGTRLRIVGPDASGLEWIPEQRDLFGAVLVDLDALHTLGLYAVRAGDTLVTRLAVNTAPRESNPAAYAPEEAAQRLSEALGVPVQVLEGNAETLRKALTTGTPAGVEIWNVFLLAALAFLIAEMLVARRRTPELMTA